MTWRRCSWGARRRLRPLWRTTSRGSLAGNAGAWSQWAKGLKANLTAGECNHPLDYTMFDYLDIGTGWQRPLQICKGDRIRISGSVSDGYKLSDGGPWINVEGDPAQPTSGADWPCNLEGCKAGMLIMKHVGKSGMEGIVLVARAHHGTGGRRDLISDQRHDLLRQLVQAVRVDASPHID